MVVVGAARRRLAPWRGIARAATPFKTISTVAVTALALLAIYPLASVLVHIFYSDGHLTVSPTVRALGQQDVAGLVLNTVIVVTASTAAALLIGSVLAWVNERTDARIGLFTDFMPMAPFLLPPIAGAVGWVLLLSPQAGFANVVLRDVLGWIGISVGSGPLNIYSWYGLIVVYTIYQVPFAFMMVAAGLRNTDPSVEEQSRVSGAGPWRTLRRVTLPGMRPAIAGAALLMVWSGFGMFSVPSIIGTGAHIPVLSVRIVQLLSFSYPPQPGAAVGLSLILIAFVVAAWYAQRRVLRGGRYATIGGKAQGARRVSLGRWRWPVRVAMLAYLAVTTVLPIVALILVTLNGYWTPHIRWSHLSFGAVRSTVVDDLATQQALRDSLLLGVAGATIGIAAAALVSLYVLRTSPRVGRFVDGAIKVPATTFPHVVIALGFVFAFAGPPFRLEGTLVLLLLAYLALYLPLGTVATDGAIGQVGRELADASHVCGAGEARTFRKVFVPLMVPGLVSGWALLFVRIVGDLEASSILAGTNSPVVGYQILQIYTNGSYSELAALSTILTLVTSILVVFVLWLGRRHARWAGSSLTSSVR